MFFGLGRFRDTSALAGWLFADFMLALGMLFLIASTVGSKAPPDAPTITGFAPTSGPIGTQVRIAGTNFKDVREVHFGQGLAIQTHIDSEGQITAAVPQGATTDLITVVTAHGMATSPGPFTVTLPPTPTLTPTPIPTSTPTTAPTPVPSVTPTPTATPCQATLGFDLVPIFVGAGPGGGAPTEEVLREKFAGYVNQSAGLVIAYGQSTNQAEGEQLARNAYAALRAALPNVFTERTILKAQHDTSSNSHNIEFDVLFFASRCD